MRPLFYMAMVAGFLFPAKIFSQTAVIRGIVQTPDSFALSGAIVLPNSNISCSSCDKYVVCGQNGEFQLTVPAAMNQLIVSLLGYRTVIKSVTLKPGEAIFLTITLDEDVKQLLDAEVFGKTAADEVKENPQTVTVIDTRQLYGQSSGTNEIINRASGVKVRQEGGFGSNADFSINGISGKQVKLFIDGVPAEYLGSGLGINVLPVNLVDRIEVYKGVVPVELGADALGGAIQVVTRKSVGNYLDMGYSTGSFNTHKASFNTRYMFKHQFFLVLNGFYNSSENNYFIDVEIPDQYGTPCQSRVKRFHDACRNYSGSMEMGFSGKKWADVFSITAGHSGMFDELQHNAVMYQPFGKVNKKENAFNTTFKFHKKFLYEKLDLKLFAGYNNISSLFADTSFFVYAWNGSIVAKRPASGEVSASRNLLYLNTNNGIGKLNLDYKLAAASSIHLSLVNTYYDRRGHDSIAEKYYGRDYFQQPARMMKNVWGTAFHQKLLDERISSITSLKWYHYKANGYEINEFHEQINTSQIQNQLGYNQAIKFQFTDHFFTRASYEYATRLPDEYEAFGDFTLVKPNPGIKPEISDNVNVGMMYRGRKLSLELNGFYRYMNHVIFLKTSRFFSQHLNLLRSEIKGIEGEVKYKPLSLFELTVNGTFQDIRNKSSQENSGTVDNRYYNARIPNIPYFFGNGEFRFIKENLFWQNNLFQAWWYTSYTHAFFLYWTIDGAKNTKAVIPAQFVNNAGISFSFLHNGMTAAVEVFNLGNVKTFDNYSVQKPGRSVSIKLRYFINKNL